MTSPSVLPPPVRTIEHDSPTLASGPCDSTVVPRMSVIRPCHEVTGIDSTVRNDNSSSEVVIGPGDRNRKASKMTAHQTGRAQFPRAVIQGSESWYLTRSQSGTRVAEVSDPFVVQERCRQD